MIIKMISLYNTLNFLSPLLNRIDLNVHDNKNAYVCSRLDSSSVEGHVSGDLKVILTISTHVGIYNLIFVIKSVLLLEYYGRMTSHILSTKRSQELGFHHTRSLFRFFYRHAKPRQSVFRCYVVDSMSNGYKKILQICPTYIFV